LAYMWMGMGWIDPYSCNDGTRNWRNGFGLDAVIASHSWNQRLRLFRVNSNNI
jgi:hypothetical protein